MPHRFRIGIFCPKGAARNLFHNANVTEHLKFLDYHSGVATFFEVIPMRFYVPASRCTFRLEQE